MPWTMMYFKSLKIAPRMAITFTNSNLFSILILISVISSFTQFINTSRTANNTLPSPGPAKFFLVLEGKQGNVSFMFIPKSYLKDPIPTVDTLGITWYYDGITRQERIEDSTNDKVTTIKYALTFIYSH